MFKPAYLANGVNSNDHYSEGNYNTGQDRRPTLSYAELITMAIETSPESMLTLKEIYTWISTNYPYFQLTKSGWQNSIRHNLSLNRCFYKVPRCEGNRGKGSFWKINYEFQNIKVNYRSRRYNNFKNQNNSTIDTLSQILNDSKLMPEKIGVTEPPYKQTTVFRGNLLESEEFYRNNEYYEYNNDQKSKTDRIFSFK